MNPRNSQISHDSAAELCRALKQNHTIKALGLYHTLMNCLLYMSWDAG